MSPLLVLKLQKEHEELGELELGKAILNQQQQPRPKSDLILSLQQRR
jgi:hypothetical protein